MKKYKLLKDLDNPFFKASVGKIHTTEEWLELFGYEKISQFENIIEDTPEWFEEVVDKSPLQEMKEKMNDEIYKWYKSTINVPLDSILDKFIKDNGKEELSEWLWNGYTKEELIEMLNNYIIIKTQND